MNELVVPHSGQLVDLDDPSSCVRLLSEIRELEAKLKEVKADLTTAMTMEFSRQGTKTLNIGEFKAELRGGSEVVWDVEVLEELRALGLPEERMADLVTTEVTYRVNANVAKQLASVNTLYANVIERAKRVVPKTAYVTVKKGEARAEDLDLRPRAGGHDSGADAEASTPTQYHR